MSEFWYTTGTMRAVRGASYQAFSLFGPVHLFWLGLCALLSAVLGRWYHRAGEAARLRALRILSALMLTDEVGKYVMTASTGQWEWGYLPLHLCSINIFICLWHSIHPNRTAKEFLYALSLPGGLMALLSPTWTSLPMWNFMHLHSETIHIMLFLYPVLLLAGGFRPNWRTVPRLLAFLACLAVPIYFLNKVLNTDFMFLNGTDGAAVNVFFARIFGDRLYMLGFLPLVLALGLALYLPWGIAARRRKKS